MATLPTDRRALAGDRAADSRDTAHLKDVPRDRALREQIRKLAGRCADALDKSRPLAKHQIEAHAREILDRLELPLGFLGWTMVAVASAFWRDEIQRVPYARRLLLLPHCLKDAENCPADYTPLGLLCRDCGACRLTELRASAAAKGYHVLIAEGSPVVMQLILAGQADAVLGVGCLDSLEKALDKILLVGLPSMAVPLHASGCKNSTTDEDWIFEMIDTPYRPSQAVTETQVHLLRLVTRMFEPDEFARLLPEEEELGDWGSGLGKRGSGFGVQGSGSREQETGGRGTGASGRQNAKCKLQKSKYRRKDNAGAFRFSNPEPRVPSSEPHPSSRRRSHRAGFPY